MTTAWHSPNIIHDGYMDGIHGKDPNPEFEECEGYQDGYLLGAEGRGPREIQKGGSPMGTPEIPGALRGTSHQSEG